MKLIFRIAAISITFIFLLSSCSILDQTSEMKTFTECTFRLLDVENAVLAGVDIQDVHSFSDLSFTEASN